MKSHTTRLTDKENGLAVTRAQKKAVAQACRFARACGLEGELWVLRGEACGTLALGHVLDVLDEQRTPIRVVTSISVGNDKTPPKIFHQRVDKFSTETAKEFAWRPIERNGEPITLAEATQGWDAAARDKIQELWMATRRCRKSAVKLEASAQVDRLSASGWSLGCVSAIDSTGRVIFTGDAYARDGRRFTVLADKRLTTFMELEAAICTCGKFALTQ
jgi:hypothetical protein